MPNHATDMVIALDNMFYDMSRSNSRFRNVYLAGNDQMIRAINNQWSGKHATICRGLRNDLDLFGLPQTFLVKRQWVGDLFRAFTKNSQDSLISHHPCPFALQNAVKSSR
jgi:hypothetical protein